MMVTKSNVRDVAEALVEAITISDGVAEPFYTLRLVKLGADMRGTWDAKRQTLSQQHGETWAAKTWIAAQVTMQNHHMSGGAYAVIMQKNGSRWLYTTTRGNAQVRTLRRWGSVEEITGDLRELVVQRVERSILKAMEKATADGRSRQLTVRGAVA